MSDTSDMNDLKALAAQLAAIRAQVKTHGGFVGDRELHQCPACGLMEDVLYGGKLVTYWHQTSNPLDTGLRFKEVGTSQLACPFCAGVSFVVGA